MSQGCHAPETTNSTANPQAPRHEARRRSNIPGLALPSNQKTGHGDLDWLRREGDCFVLNSIIPIVETDWGCKFQSVRGVFQEGAAVFKGSGMKLKSHIQIAVRDPEAIIGYFLPKGL